METNKIKEIFILVKENLINNDFKTQSGICNEITKLYIKGILSPTEHRFILSYLYENIPEKDNQYSKFTNGKYWMDSHFWWNPIDEVPRTKRIRINYLTELIKNII